MWQVLAAIAGVGAAGISAYQQRKAGKAAQQDARRQADAMRNSIAMIELTAIQQHNDRVQQLQDFASHARAMSAYMGRDDRSVDAIMKRAEADKNKDLQRIKLQSLLEVSQTLAEANALEYTGKAQRQAAAAQSVSTLLNAASKAASSGAN